MAEIERTISSAELVEWEAFDCIQPFGDIRAELHAAMVAHAVAMWAGKTLKDGASLQLTDMMVVTKVPKPSKEAQDWLRTPGIQVVKYGDSGQSRSRAESERGSVLLRNEEGQFEPWTDQ